MSETNTSHKQVLAFATASDHKLSELRAIIHDYEVKGLVDLGILDDIVENGHTIEQNAEIKANYLYEKTGLRSLAEDTGLLVDALNGAPGVHTARYAGDERSADKNNQKLLHALLNNANRKAHFKTVITLVDKGESHFFIGIVDGIIALAPAGVGGFGYDPIFIPDGYDLPFASLPSEIKNKISHRSRAVSKLLAFLQK